MAYSQLARFDLLAKYWIILSSGWLVGQFWQSIVLAEHGFVLMLRLISARIAFNSSAQ